jgi:hypothetical protein
MNFMESGGKVVDWIRAAEDRDHWQAVSDTIMDIYIYTHKNLKQIL